MYFHYFNLNFKRHTYSLSREVRFEKTSLGNSTRSLKWRYLKIYIIKKAIPLWIFLMVQRTKIFSFSHRATCLFNKFDTGKTIITLSLIFKMINSPQFYVAGGTMKSNSQNRLLRIIWSRKVGPNLLTDILICMLLTFFLKNFILVKSVWNISFSKPATRHFLYKRIQFKLNPRCIRNFSVHT